MFGRCTASACLMVPDECIGFSWLRRPVVVSVTDSEFKLCSASVLTLAELASHGARRATCLLQLQLHAR